ncbi:uncharacterized protein YjiS (DUF1127 family) [Rhodovulum imhoffii]|uniref:Uncharacterized protein YjiS (DUF1127 family) n=1 Tax=Rhodovulum imhoffii TaxID=365340 RepID=A0A2T5BW34_9RHOB|nr:DUF1127 domain-containing protein [Rhodovulum imhoffii]MBK5935180.1 hypothetical protein [Rhodovulum imhoffii]PTN03852.1 uncharacterized protein YjiS (DUF1127 family) [Rhodovulum imhoffii]
MPHVIAHSRPHTAPAGLSRLVRHFSLALTAARQRRHLAQLDDALLRDIGLTRQDVQHELERPVWDVPASWLK